MLVATTTFGSAKHSSLLWNDTACDSNKLEVTDTGDVLTSIQMLKLHDL